MSPRDLVNEIACQGWPWNPESEITNLYGKSRVADEMPFWFDATTEVCGPDKDQYLCMTDGTRTERALFVQDVEKLRNVLSMIMVEASATAVTRTDVVAWNVPHSEQDAVQQYEFRSGYVLRPGEQPLGVLTRQDYGCSDEPSDTDAPVTPGTHNIAEQLANQTSRTLYSYEDPSITYIEPDLTNISQWINRTIPTAELADLTDCDFCSTEQDYCVTDLCSAKSCANPGSLCNYLVDETKGHGLADIYNSTPAVLGKPLGGLSRSSYFDYQNAHASRRPHLFVGTNDGVLHAFDLDEVSDDTTTSVESWGFLPRSVLRDLQSLYPQPKVDVTYDSGLATGYSVDASELSGSYGRAFLMDGPPVASDVMLIRKAEEYDAAFEDLTWRGMVFGGTGKNNRSYYALDVTDVLKDTTGTVKPELRWELSPSDNLLANNDPDPTKWPRQALDRMGAPVSRPA